MSLPQIELHDEVEMFVAMHDAKQPASPHAEVTPQIDLHDEVEMFVAMHES